MTYPRKRSSPRKEAKETSTFRREAEKRKPLSKKTLPSQRDREKTRKVH